MQKDSVINLKMSSITSRGVKGDSLDTLLLIDDHYSVDCKHFVKYLRETHHGICLESIKAYAADLREERDGKRYAARTVNKRLAAVKNRVRMMIQAEDLKASEVYALETALSEIKNEKINTSAVSSDRILSEEEVNRLIEATHDRKIALIIEFLYTTGTRINEALGILLNDCDIGARRTLIRVSGKGSKERWIKIPTELYERIREKFVGRKYLFEHSEKQYSRTSVSYRIKIESLKYLHKDISAHTLRHSFATAKIQETGKIKGVSRYLGHSSTSTTLDMYVHEELDDEELGIEGDKT